MRRLLCFVSGSEGAGGGQAKAANSEDNLERKWGSVTGLADRFRAVQRVRIERRLRIFIRCQEMMMVKTESFVCAVLWSERKKL